MQLVRMPSLAENVEEATIAEWLVKKGDSVTKDQPMAEIVTEKAEFTFEYIYDLEGEVLEVFATEKSVLPVGYILLAVGDASEASSAEIASARAENDALIKKINAGPALSFSMPDSGASSASTFAANTERVRATPAARRLAKELGVELSAVFEAQAPDGPVREEHVRAFAETR